ncbi:MAG TPA: hypothetical protein PLA69_10260, partial [Flavobacterium sp.]|nr:hypothetical protein [Flavobacterium sp.]
IAIEGIVSIPENNEAIWNFVGNGEIFWNNGTLRGPGTLINNANVNLATSSSKIIDNLLTLNNNGILRITAVGDLFLNNGTINNLQSGLIDLQADGGNITFTGVNTKILNNTGTIRKSTSVGVANIEVELENSGTLDVTIGTLTLNNPGISLVGGIYTVAAGSGMNFQSTITLSESLSGTLAGQIVWQGNLSVPVSASFDFATVDDGSILWGSGNLTGGGVLTNNSTLKLLSASSKSIVNQTTLNNANCISIESTGDLFLVNGILNNLPSGILYFVTNGGDITFTGSALHQVNNQGTIRNIIGNNAIYADLLNQGTIWVDVGILTLDSVDTHLMAGTYNVSSSGQLIANSPTCSLSLGGVLEGIFRFTGTVTIPVGASLDFSGSQPVVW